MHTSTVFLLAVVATLAAAAPQPSPEQLQSDHGNISVAIGDFNNPNSRRTNMLERRTDVPNCKGSGFCTTKQGFKNDCSKANQLLQPTTYIAGGGQAGSASGTCSGYCGLFIQGSADKNGNKCQATGIEIANGYQEILNNGCQACGSVAAPEGGDCIITVNYVSGC